mgnify:CR=1 FL=1
MTSVGKGSAGRGRRLAIVALGVAGALLLGGCAGKRAQADASRQPQALDRARGLCRDFGYAPGTAEFARCAQSEYDRGWQAPSQAVVPPQVVVPPPGAPVPQAAQPQPAPQADNDSDNWLINWLKRPPVCATAACSIR